VLSHKPGAFAGSKPLAQGRAAGRWPACYDELWDRLRARHGKQNGTRAMVAVLALGREFGHDQLRTAVAATVSLGACDVAAVRHLLTEANLHKARPEPVEVGALARYDRPLQISPTTTRCSCPRHAREPHDERLSGESIRQRCKTLRMPTIGGQFARLAKAATREGDPMSATSCVTGPIWRSGDHRLLHEAKLPRMKTLDAFEFDRFGVSAGQLRTLAEGDYVTKAEPILLVGEAGCGKDAPGDGIVCRRLSPAAAGSERSSLGHRSRRTG
jgi:hypothetical protein